jgi:two-component system, chemotaxis family, protein-glutamate methylesterase/glutaminase
MTAVLAAPPAAVAAAPTPIRVMVVDDSVVVRGLVARWLAEEPDLTVVASLRTGAEAVEQVERADPDVVILDIEMPELDGLSALPLLLRKKRDLVVIMASALTRRHAEVSFKALSLGAADYVPKPESNRGVTTSPEFRRELTDKIRQLGARRRRRADTQAPTVPLVRDGARAFPAAEKAADHAPPAIRLRPWSRNIPRVLLIGSSTGGPQALTGMMAHLSPVSERAPVLITQHMPPTFTTILAEHLARASRRPAREAEDGEAVMAGRIYVAPGGRHMLVTRRQGRPVIRLDDGPPVNFCKPAVDPLFSSATEVWGGSALAVILTGMGCDGAHGAEDLVAAGGNVIAQDEASSVVWGMPGSAVHAGVCAAVLPLEAIAPKVVRVFAGDVS